MIASPLRLMAEWKHCNCLLNISKKYILLFLSFLLPRTKSYIQLLDRNAPVAVWKERMFWAVVLKNTDAQADRQTGRQAGPSGSS